MKEKIFIEKIKQKLLEKLPVVFSERELIKLLEQMYQDSFIGRKTKSAILKSVKRVDLKWNKKADCKLLTFNPSEIQIIDILAAFQPQHYMSHFSALYLHGLTNQRPEEYFLSKEIKRKTSPSSKEKIPEKIYQAFLKAPRKTNKYLSYQKTKITLLEKQDIGKIGVNKKLVTVNKKRPISLFFTSIERTLIDSIISPHYSGGIKTVVNAFSKAKINIHELYKIYKAYSPFYPYWQSIGFLFYKLKSVPISKKWLKYFSSKKIEFYLDKKFNENWAYDSKWKIYYQKGIMR